jgi:hypothetical protein
VRKNNKAGGKAIFTVISVAAGFWIIPGNEIISILITELIALGVLVTLFMVLLTGMIIRNS